MATLGWTIIAFACSAYYWVEPGQSTMPIRIGCGPVIMIILSFFQVIVPGPSHRMEDGWNLEV